MGGLSYDPELADVERDGYVSGPVSVTSAAIEAKVGASRLTGREGMSILNKGPARIYYGPAGVTVTTGSIIEKGQTLTLSLGDTLGVWLICDTGQTAIAIVQEMS